MNKESSEKLIEIIQFYKKNINNEDKKISEFSKLKYYSYVNYAKKYNINVENKIDESNNIAISNEEYINNICNNKELKYKIEEYNNILKNNLLNLNKEFINTWINNYKDFVEKNNLEKNQMIIYANKLISSCNKKEYIIDNNFKLYETNSIKEAEKKKQKNNEKVTLNDIEELKIISRKKAKNAKANIIVLTGISLASITLLGLPISGSIAVIYILHKLKNNIKYENKINELLKKYKIIQNENGTLMDEEGKIIDSNYKDKKIYNMIKQELIKLETEVLEGKIKKSYKKNKLTSKLLNNKIIVNFNNKLKNTIEDSEELSETQDIKKGLGAVK